jgi:hypothetical protein
MPVPFCLTKNHTDYACQLQSQFKLDHFKLHQFKLDHFKLHQFKLDHFKLHQFKLDHFKLHQFKLELCKLNYKLLRAQFENESKPVCVLGWNVIEHDNVTYKFSIYNCEFYKL